MAIGRIGGPMLKENLIRQGVDLSFETNLLYLDVNNMRVGVNQAVPTVALEVNGAAKFGNVQVNGNVQATSTIQGTQLISNIAIGTAPFTVTSTTQVANLNVALAGTVTTAAQPNITSVGILDLLDVDNINISGNTISSSNTNGNIDISPNGTGNINLNDPVQATSTIQATRFISNVAIGTAPFTVTSTTQVANLNVATAGTVTTAAQPNITSTGTLTSLTVTGNVNTSASMNDSIGNIRNIVNNAQGGAYILAEADNGKLINITTGGVTVNTSIFTVGNNITIFNNSSSSQTITQGVGVTMYQAGTATTGNRTLAQRGICTIVCVANSTTFVISGAGLT